MSNFDRATESRLQQVAEQALRLAEDEVQELAEALVPSGDPAELDQAENRLVAEVARRLVKLVASSR